MSTNEESPARCKGTAVKTEAQCMKDPVPGTEFCSWHTEGYDSSKHSVASTDGVSNRKLTVANPVAPVQCTATSTRSGERCKRWSIRGATVCVKHGGRLPNVRQHAEAVVEAARLRIIGLSDAAIDTLEDLNINANGEQVRLQAANSLLDRAGVKGPMEIDVTVSQGESPAERARKRLADIADRIESANQPEPPEEDDVVDAEIVDEDS